MNSDWYQQEWKPSPRDEALHQLAAEYHRRTEDYDRTVCTGPIRHGSIMPATHHEMGLINRNAIKVLKELQHKAADQGFTIQELRNAIGKFHY